MQLHHDIELFNEIAGNTAEALGNNEEIVRKDYFVSLFLKEYKKLEPSMVLKGGTSLSKCYGVINRFSEDIDLTFHHEGRPLTEGQRKRVNYHVRDTCEDLAFKILNLDETRSRRHFTKYDIDTGFTNLS